VGSLLWTRNGLAVPVAEVPLLAIGDWREACVETCSSGARLAALARLGAAEGGAAGILAVLADDARGRIGLARTAVPAGGAYPALTAELPQAQALERDLFERHAIRPEGHPWLKPLRRHAELETGAPGHEFFRVEGPVIHEVAVGPVHAGIIEPGHFRFQCHGETVLSLEIQLGYQHRGAEALLLRSGPARRLVVAESIAGDTSIGHALAYCEAIEALSGAEPPLAGQALRGLALEIERLANHAGDLGALCNDVGYLPGASWLGRLRGEFLNMLLEISGNRFGRGLIVPGGARFGVAADRRRDFLDRLAVTARDLESTASLLFDSPSVSARFERAGALGQQDADLLGLVGPAARACGCDRDARRDHPSGIYRFAHVPVSLADTGDVMARALLRWLESRRSIEFVRDRLEEMAGEPALSIPLPPGAPHSLAVALVEGWRGEIVHVAESGPGGDLASYAVVDPSLHNWFGLAMAMREQPISDFPLCNKSFNLSYAGHDL
jgi:Ni,Fe-hydrogenase III large subunit